MKNIVYKGVVISPASEAYQMWLVKDFKKLDVHMKMLDDKYKRLEGRL
jgi:hypothetical protein